MNFKIPETMSVSGSAVTALIGLGDGDAALLYLYLTAVAGPSATADGQSSAPLSKAPSWNPERTRAALDKLVSLKLVPESAVANGAPIAAEPAAPAAKAGNKPGAQQTDKQFYTLVQEVQRLFGRMLSSDELVRLFGIYDSIGLPPEVILQLVVYCAAETLGQGGAATPPSMKYIEKAAYTWEREGIFTLEHAERYIKERAERKQESAKIKALLQIRDRNLAPSERKYVEGWLALGFGSEAIAIAYDRTVTKTGKLSWGYMNSIINSWHGKGLHTAEDILTKDMRANTRTGAAGVSVAPDESEVLRINRILFSLNEEN